MASAHGPSLLQSPAEPGGKRDDASVLARVGGVVQAGKQAGPLGADPDQRLSQSARAGAAAGRAVPRLRAGRTWRAMKALARAAVCW
jgi:hypothetical protein